MKKSGIYLLLAYASGFITVLCFIFIIGFTVYGQKEEGGMGIVNCAPYWMALMGLCGLFFSGKYLFEKYAVERSTIKSLIDLVIVFPALFLACLQLYAAAVFFAAL